MLSLAAVAWPVLSTYRCTRSSQTFGEGAEKSVTADTVQIKSMYFSKTMPREPCSIREIGSQTKRRREPANPAMMRPPVKILARYYQIYDVLPWLHASL